MNSHLSAISQENVGEIENSEEATPTVKAGIEEIPEDELETINNNQNGEIPKSGVLEDGPGDSEDVITGASGNLQNTVLEIVEATADPIQDTFTQSKLPTVSKLGLLRTGLFNDKVKIFIANILLKLLLFFF